MNINTVNETKSEGKIEPLAFNKIESISIVTNDLKFSQTMFLTQQYQLLKESITHFDSKNSSLKGRAFKEQPFKQFQLLIYPFLYPLL